MRRRFLIVKRKIIEDTIAETTTEEVFEDDDSGWTSGDDWGSDDDWGSGDDWGSDDDWNSGDDWGSDDDWNSDDDWGSDDDWSDDDTDEKVEEVTKKEERKKEEHEVAEKEEKPKEIPIEYVEVVEVENTSENFDYPSIDILPISEGIYAHIEREDIALIMLHDTLEIKDAIADYILQDNKIIVYTGRIDWKPLAPAGVFCLVDSFVIDLNKREFTAEFASLVYEDCLDTIVQGQFYYRDTRSSKGNIYRFKSYNYGIPIKLDSDIHLTIHLTGAPSLYNNRMSSVGYFPGYSYLDYTSNGVKLFEASSKTGYFIFDDQIRSKNTAVKIPFKEDGISTKNVGLTLNTSDHKLRLYNHKEFDKKIPYDIPYFQFFIYADGLSWDLESDSLFIVSNGISKPVTLESYDYFSSAFYRKLSTYYGFSPIKYLYLNYGAIDRFVSITEAAKTLNRRLHPKSKNLNHLNHSLKNTRQMLIGLTKLLSSNGLIRYHTSDKNLFTFTPKLVHYLSANTHTKYPNKGKDFDKIRLRAYDANQENLSVHLEKAVMTLKGVPEFYLSDSNNISVRPRGSLKIHQNRNMKFDGFLGSDMLVAYGTEFAFNYEKFIINLAHGDSLFFILSGEDGKKALSNKISNVKGKVYLASPDNKSGVYPKGPYPKLSTESDAPSFYKAGVVDSAYLEKVYLLIDPFNIESTEVSSSSVKLTGTFFSSGIFPEIHDIVYIETEGFYEFDAITPKDGYKIYTDSSSGVSKGNFVGGLTMTRNGLIGDGKLENLSFSSTFNEFIFFPDSLLASQVGSGQIKGGVLEDKFEDKIENYTSTDEVTVPSVEFRDYNMKWYVPQDSMIFLSDDRSFNVFESKYPFKGYMVLSRKGLTGKGRLGYGE